MARRITGTPHRSAINIITDNQATTGMVTMQFDVLYSTTANDFLLKVWGVNDSGAAAGIQWDGEFDLNGPLGNPDGLDLRNPGQDTTLAVSYTGSEIDELLSTDAAGLGLSGSADWQTDIEFSFDLGATGYDQVVIGFGFHDGGISGVDNLSQVITPTPVPEPSGLAIASLLGLIGLCVCRRLRPSSRDSK